MYSPINTSSYFTALSRKRFIYENTLALLLQYIGLSATMLASNSMSCWAASGVSFAFLLLRGYTILPGLIAGTFSACLCAQSGLLLAFAYTAILTLQSIFLVIFTRRITGATLLFYRNSPFYLFVGFTVLLTGLCSLLLITISGISVSLSSAWLANLNGVLIFALSIIAWDAYFPDIAVLKSLSRSQIAICAVSLSTMTLSLLFTSSSLMIYGLSTLILGILIVIGRLYSWYGLLTGLLIWGFLLDLGAYLDTPLFTQSSATNSLFYLQLLLGITTISGLWLFGFTKTIE